MGSGSGTFHESYAQDMAIFRTRRDWGILLAFLVFFSATLKLDWP